MEEWLDEFLWKSNLKIVKVGGSQAEGAKQYLTKITKDSANQLLHLGYGIIMVGNKVAPWHFFGGYHLAHKVEPSILKETDFDSYVRNFEFYLDPELGDKTAFFVSTSDLKVLERAVRGRQLDYQESQQSKESWYAGHIDYNAEGTQVFEALKLDYEPTERKHPSRWKYAIGPYPSKNKLKKAVRIPGSTAIFIDEI